MLHCLIDQVAHGGETLTEAPKMETHNIQLTRRSVKCLSWKAGAGPSMLVVVGEVMRKQISEYVDYYLLHLGRIYKKEMSSKRIG